MELRELQERMKELYFENDSRRGLYATFTWLVEEVGELAEALLSGNKEACAEEIADVVAWTLSVANLLGVDVEDAIKRKYNF
ncbi:MAG: nucleotide pyrophosphohydrolase [Sulfolobales archaeon]|nr:nucleotide pyrophosphohydrolase [Sulfolobales archaeon]